MKDVGITFKVSQKEKEVIAKGSAKAKQTMSAFAREAILDRAIDGEPVRIGYFMKMLADRIKQGEDIDAALKEMTKLAKDTAWKYRLFMLAEMEKRGWRDFEDEQAANLLPNARMS